MRGYTFEEKILNQEQLEGLLEYWQKRLRLQDWIIKVEIVRGPELDGSLAKIYPSLHKKMAHIKLTDPLDYPPGSMKPYDMESTLVHELVHLHLYPLTHDKDDSPEEEQAVECLEYALVTLADQVKRLADELAARDAAP